MNDSLQTALTILIGVLAALLIIGGVVYVVILRKASKTYNEIKNQMKGF